MKLRLQPGQQVAVAIGDKQPAIIIDQADTPMVTFSPSMAALLLVALQDAADQGLFNPTLYSPAEVQHV